MSASKRPTLHPIFFNAKARLVAKVDLPTPPLALEIAIVNLVPMIGFFSTLTLEDTIFVRDFLVLALLSTAFLAAIIVLKFAAFKGWVMKFFGLTFVGSYIAYIMLLSGLI